MALYSQLIDLEEEVLDRTRELSAQQPPEIRAAVQRTNVDPLVLLLQQLQIRLEVWTAHLGQSDADQSDSERRTIPPSTE